MVWGRILRSIDSSIPSHENTREPVRRILRGSPTSGFTADEVSAARAVVWDALGITQPPQPSGLQPHLFIKYAELSGDPDTDLGPWLLEGAPLGALYPITPRGIFPMDQKPNLDDPLNLVELWRGSWENYISAEEDPSITLGILNALVDGQKALCYDLSLGEGPDEVTIANKLGRVTREKPDGSLKHRLVWDLRRSGVNNTICQGERILLPNIINVVDSARSLSSQPMSDAGHLGPVDCHLLPQQLRFWSQLPRTRSRRPSTRLRSSAASTQSS